MRLEWLGGAAAIALLATMGSASATPVSCGTGCVLNATVSPPLPSGLENYGTSATYPTNGFVSNTPITVGIETITFTGGVSSGGTGTPSGLYTGNTQNVATSPFISGPPTTFGPGTQGLNYLAAQPGGSVTSTYTTPQTAFGLLWGSVDGSDSRNLLVSGPTASFNINGGLVETSLGTFTDGVTNAVVQIALTGTSFTTVTASDAAGQASAFEFVKTAVPEPTSMAILGAALAGFGVLRRRRKTT
jgi:hypothetical protein